MGEWFQNNLWTREIWHWEEDVTHYVTCVSDLVPTTSTLYWCLHDGTWHRQGLVALSVQPLFQGTSHRDFTLQFKAVWVVETKFSLLQQDLLPKMYFTWRDWSLRLVDGSSRIMCLPAFTRIVGHKTQSPIKNIK